MNLNLRFKGSRDYLHGTDMHEAICQWLRARGLEPDGSIDLALHKIARFAVTPTLDDEPAPAEGETVAAFKFGIGERRHTVKLRLTKEAVEGRYPYPEDEIVAACRLSLEARSVVLEQALPFTNVEMLVAMQKGLLQALFPEAPGKWYFTRLQLSEPIFDRPFAKYEVAFESQLGLQLVGSRVVLGGRPVGRIYFSLVA